MVRRELKRLPPSKRQYVRTFPAVLRARAIQGAKPGPFPGFVEPSLATLRHTSPSGGNWVHEIKYDGYRLQLHIQDGSIRLFTRRGYDWTSRFESIVEAAWHLKAYRAVIDGEVIVPMPEGHSDFHALERDLGAGRSDRFAFYAFDLMHLDGLDLREAALLDRKDVLAELLAGAPEPLRFSEHVEADGAEVFANACRLALEGIVSKRRDGRYRSGRNDVWAKATCRHRETFVVVGWAEKNRKFDGIYLGRNEKGELVYAGKLEAGFSEEDKKAILERLRPLQVKQQPIAAPRKFPKARWVKPAVLIDAEFRGKTGDGLLRHPSYHGVREDLMETPARRPARPVGRRDATRAPQENPEGS
jgi:bifunctional non-homologous end joining protein LigD